MRVIRNGTLLATPFLDISNQVSCCNEQGLLSIAFDPSYPTNGTFYLDYTNLSGDTNVERFVVSNPTADVANVIAATKIITIGQPEANHNGGQLQFGPDGYLYIGMGDGGGAGDQHGANGNGQNPAVLLGKILRVNVRGVPTYTIPPSNPFTQTTGYRPEIWALGLRNPWRFTFDRLNGDMYIGDVAKIAGKKSIISRARVTAVRTTAGASWKVSMRLTRRIWAIAASRQSRRMASRARSPIMLTTAHAP